MCWFGYGVVRGHSSCRDGDVVGGEPQDRGALSEAHGEGQHLLSTEIWDSRIWVSSLVGQALGARRGLNPFPITRGELAHGGGFISS